MNLFNSADRADFFRVLIWEINLYDQSLSSLAWYEFMVLSQLFPSLFEGFPLKRSSLNFARCPNSLLLNMLTKIILT